MHEAETEGEQPAPFEAGADDVLEGHPHDRERDERFDQGLKPEGAGREPHRGRDQRDRMRGGERGDDHDERADAPERDDEAEHEEQMIEALEDVAEAEPDESEEGLVPARVQRYQARVAGELEHALGAAVREESEHGHGAEPEVGERGPDRESGVGGSDGVLEEHVEHRLLPGQLGVGRERRRAEVGEGEFVVGERAVRGQGHARGGDASGREWAPILVNLEIVRDPETGGVVQQRGGRGDVEVAGPAQRELDVAHGLERNADDEAQPLRLGPDEREYGHVRGDLVRVGPRG